MNYFPTVAVQDGACKEHSTQFVDTIGACYKAAGNMMPNYVAVNFYMVLKYLLLTDAGAELLNIFNIDWWKTKSCREVMGEEFLMF